MNYGIMQGRLLPKFKGLYQSHPIGFWSNEFEIASSLKLNSIEFIFDYNLYSFNPIYKNPGIIKELINKTKVKVKSICADFFMTVPIQNCSYEEITIYGLILEKLIQNLKFLEGSNIVIPFVDKSSIKNLSERKFVANFLNEFKNICRENNITLALETDFSPQDFLEFFELLDENHISVNYDSGNSASLGYSFEEEMKCYGDKISNIHIKDRTFKGGPVPLGSGNADLRSLKEYIKNSKYSDLIIFQAYRDDEGIEIFKKQYEYFKNL